MFIVSNSHLVAGLLSREYPHLKEKIRIIHNGFEPEVFRPAKLPKHVLRRRLGLPPEGTMLLLSGSGFPRKGLHHAVELLRRLRKNKNRFI